VRIVNSREGVTFRDQRFDSFLDELNGKHFAKRIDNLSALDVKQQYRGERWRIDTMMRWILNMNPFYCVWGFSQYGQNGSLFVCEQGPSMGSLSAHIGCVCVIIEVIVKIVTIVVTVAVVIVEIVSKVLIVLPKSCVYQSV
jgi:hypothetical protein